MKVDWFTVFGTAIALFLVVMGATWWLAPGRFVRIYRRVQFAEKAAKTAEWERGVRSTAGRAAGGFFLIFGCILLWVMYSPFHPK